MSSSSTTTPHSEPPSELLSWQGYHVEEASDGAEALAVAIVAPPDVIVTDLEMPVMAGTTFIQRCRELPGLDEVPIVVMSATEAETVNPQLRTARVSACLTKPFGLVELTTAIERDASQR